MNFVFLDIDGVLNDNYTTEKTPESTPRSPYAGIDNSKVKMLAAICDALSASIVLTSDWRDCIYKKSPDGFYLVGKLREENLYLAGIIPTLGRRGHEITKFIEAYGLIDKYLIIDDDLKDFFDYEQIATHTLHTSRSAKAGEKEAGIFNAKPLIRNLSTEDNELKPSDEVLDAIKIIESYKRMNW